MRTSLHASLVAMQVAACGRSGPTSEPGPTLPAVTPAGWLKGQLHIHTNRSGDSQTPPERVATWYKAHGYDFIVLTDHNVVGGLDPGLAPPGLLVLPGVELTTNLEHCVPSEGREPCLLHVNALVVAPDASARGNPSRDGDERERVFTGEIATARELGGVAQLNHPNFHYSANAELIAKLASTAPLLVEFENQTSDSMNAGDAAHPSTQALWDRVLALGGRVYGTATDDAHHYDDADSVRARGEPAFTGDVGWVMVRAERTADAIRDALGRGDFYASNGVMLESLAITGDGITLRPQTPCELACIDAQRGVVAKTRGRDLHCPRTGSAIVRAVATDDTGRHAWTQASSGH